MFATKNPVCRAIPFKGAPEGNRNMVEMAQAGRCYEDNPADLARFLDLYKLSCTGFADNFYECGEVCPFSP